MGRWKRKPFKKSNSNNSNNKKRKDSSATASSGEDNESASSSFDLPWSHLERRDLLNYLHQYRKGAIRVYHGGNVVDEMEGGSEDLYASRVIGDVEFPALTSQTLSQPYLALPLQLTSKQRRMAHECCGEGK